MNEFSGPLAETTVGALLGELAALLDRAGIPDPGREARDMIAALRDAPRFWTTVNGHTVMSADERELARAAAMRRARGAPFAYAVRSAAFRRLSLFVDERVLIPRPETELLVDIVLELMGGRPEGPPSTSGPARAPSRLRSRPKGRSTGSLAATFPRTRSTSRGPTSVDWTPPAETASSSDVARCWRPFSRNARRSSSPIRRTSPTARRVASSSVRLGAGSGPVRWGRRDGNHPAHYSRCPERARAGRVVGARGRLTTRLVGRRSPVHVRFLRGYQRTI